MAATRYNYTTVRTEKKNIESTFPLRYILNTPGPGKAAPLPDDVHILWQGNGGNMMVPRSGHPIDVDTALRGQFNRLSRDCRQNRGIEGTIVHSTTQSMDIVESRTIAPSWEVIEQPIDRSHSLVLDFQGHAISSVDRPQNTSLGISDAYDRRFVSSSSK